MQADSGLCRRGRYGVWLLGVWLLGVQAMSCRAEDGRARGSGVGEMHFEGQSLRIDFELAGNDTMRTAALVKLRQEPVWSAPMRNWIDPFGYGEYFVWVTDPETGDTLYSRGFNTLFEEWRTTKEAKERTRGYLNTVYVPYPRHAVTVTISGRSREDMQFYPLLSFGVSPEDGDIERGGLKSYPVTELVGNGSVKDHVDLLFVSEGYSGEEEFVEDARRFTVTLFETPPFSEYKDRFNVRAVYVDTPLGTSFNTFSIARYLTPEDVTAVSDVRWDVPCDGVVILVNTEVYGGAGIYNFYATTASDNARSPHIFVHEWGHSFGGLADEYYTSEVAYDNFYALDKEPWEPNITTLVHFEGKWGDLLSPGTPIPTPLVEPYEAGTGVFEGGGYNAKGIYRPSDHCMMRDYAPFCPACSRAIVQMIEYLSPR